MNKILLTMNEAAFFRHVGWTAYFNAGVFILSLIALMIFFGIGGIWGRINDSLSVIWMISYIPIGLAFYLITRSVNAPISLVSLIIGLVAMLTFVFMQILLVLGRVSFEQTFTLVLATTAVVGLFVLIQALLARAGSLFPPGLIWAMVIYGLASVVGAVGFQVGGESQPLAIIGLLLTAIAGLVWVIWIGRLLLNESVVVALAGST
jgi:hypothetical protein